MKFMIFMILSVLMFLSAIIIVEQINIGNEKNDIP